MRRRGYLEYLEGAVSTTSVGAESAVAADSQLEPGTWDNATVDRTVDGDTAFLRDDNGRLAAEWSTADDGCSATVSVDRINAEGVTLNDE